MPRENASLPGLDLIYHLYIKKLDPHACSQNLDIMNQLEKGYLLKMPSVVIHM